MCDSNSSTLLLNKENYIELLTSLGPVNPKVPVDPEVTRTPLSQKFADISQVKVLNLVSRSPLSELLVYSTCAKKKLWLKNT